MSSPPIEIPDLDPAGPIDRSNDLLIVRQGLNDKKATVEQVSALQMGQYNTLSGSPSSTDRLIIGRNVGPGLYDNYLLPITRIGFLSGARIWFYMSSPPAGWDLVTGLGDRLLAIAQPGGASYTYNTPNVLKGSWQQQDVDGVTGKGLSIQQIPAHNHYAPMDNHNGSSTTTYASGGSGYAPYGNQSGFTTGGAGSDNSASNPANPNKSFPPALGHNHGNTWRPAAAVGCIGVKN